MLASKDFSSLFTLLYFKLLIIKCAIIRYINLVYVRYKKINNFSKNMKLKKC